MKLYISKPVFDQFDAESRRGLVPVACTCIADGEDTAACEACSGAGIVYEMTLSADDSAAIQENLRSQGVPLGKIGTQ